MLKNKLDLNKLKDFYENKKTLYEALALNLKQALSIFLNESDIPYLSISSRIKDMDSYLTKIQKKQYNNPLEELEDICGIRIICYYQSDISNICDIIEKEFKVLEFQSKEELLEINEFGYRSHHFIVNIKNEWLSTPNYRNLKNLKAEIQVRTVLMHAWAEIEHKLAYKKEEDIPKQFKRQLSRISAKLEEADEQFEKLKKDVIVYRNSILNNAEKNKGLFDKNLELNLDNLQAFLDLNFPKRQKIIKDNANLLEDLRRYNVSMNILSEYYQKSKDVLDLIESEESEIENRKIKWSQAGIVRTVLDLNNIEFFESRKHHLPQYVLYTINKYKKIINTKENK